MIRKLFPILILLAPLAVSAIKYPFINYQSPEGLPQNQISSIIQEKTGYIIIGTQSGLGKFDGADFQTITHKHGLSHNFITDMATDGRGFLWIATQEGLNLYDLEKNTFQVYTPSCYVYALAVDPQSGDIWWIANNEIYTLEKNILKKMDFSFADFATNDNPLKGLLISAKGNKYFYTDHTIFQVTPNHQITTVSTSENTIIHTVKNIGAGIAIGADAGLFLLDDENHELRVFSGMPPEIRNVYDFVEDGKNNLWVGTGNGLIRLNRTDNKITVMTKQNGLVSNRISRLFIDRENNLFIGTYNGISQLSLDYFIMYDAQDGLPHELIWSFAETEDSLLIGSENGIVEFKNGKITPANIQHLIHKSSIRAIIPLAKDNIILGSRLDGVFRWNRQDGLVDKIFPSAHVLCALHLPESNTIWLGSDAGLIKFDGIKFARFDKLLKDNFVWTLAALAPDTILVGTGKGLQQIKGDKIVHCPMAEYVGEHIINHVLVESSTQRIFVATEFNGLHIFKSSRPVAHLTMENGLLHNDIWSVLIDNADNIWFNTSVSLDRYSPNGFLSHFNRLAGLAGSGEGGIHASWKSRDGKIYFGILPGIIEILPQKETVQQKPLVLSIHRTAVNGKPVAAASPIILDYDQNNIQFDYIAVSTRKENPAHYRTMLLPLEEKWSDPTVNTFVKYLSLPPGEYLFRVTVNNGGGENRWFKAENPVRFVIKKPFWLRWWFITLIIILGILLFIHIMKVRLHSLEKQKKQLAILVEERTQEIIRKNRELMELSITDPLTDLKNRRYLEEKIKEDISLIERNLFEQKKHPNKKPEDFGFCVLGVFILDIDHFKRVNDLHGHNAGDIVIVDIARLLLELLRNSDTIVRWGGEEFLIITRQKEQNSSYELAERIRKSIEEHSFKIDSHTIIHKTVSIGFAHYPFFPNETGRLNWSHVVSLADSALYMAKRNGRNLTVGIKAGSHPLDIPFQELITDFNYALEKKFLDIICRKKKLKLSGVKTEES